MAGAADEVAEAVFKQLVDLRCSTTNKIACVTARAMIHGCYRALQQSFSPEISDRSLRDWVLDELLALDASHKNRLQ
jgi:hypothetical protein